MENINFIALYFKTGNSMDLTFNKHINAFYDKTSKKYNYMFYAKRKFTMVLNFNTFQWFMIMLFKKKYCHSQIQSDSKFSGG